MCPAKKEPVNSKNKTKVARTGFKSYMVPGDWKSKIMEEGAKVGKGLLAGGDKGEAKTLKEPEVATPVTPAAPAAPGPVGLGEDMAEKWARAEMAVEEKKMGMKEHSPKAAEVVLIVMIIGLLVLSPMLGAENKIWRTLLLIAVCFLVIAKDYIFQWLRQRIHVPERATDPMLLINLGLCILIIWSGMPLMAALVLILIVTVLSSYGPFIKQKFGEWREKRKVEKGEKIETKKASLDERAAKVFKNALIFDILDFAVGWIPIAGDVIGFMLNFKLPFSALKHKLIGGGAFFKMILVNIVDMCIGFIPVIGDIADLFPSNLINQRILKKEVERKKKGLDEGSSKMTTLLLIIIILGGLVGFTFFVAPRMAEFGGPFGDAMSSIARIPTAIKAYSREHNPVAMIKNFYKKQLLIATGDYYTGKVDENAEAKLGVYLEDIKQADPVFYTDRPLTMYATLIVHTLDKPVNVTVDCKSDKTKAGITPKIYPKSHFEVDTYEEKELDCMFPADSIKKGHALFTMSADFNFKTMSYVKTYFMDGERLRSMRREEVDPLTQYGIKDKSPTAIYTAGPVGIGMGVGKPPMGIDLEEPYTTMTLGITLENKWGGKIIGMSRFVLMLPKGFILEEIGVPKVMISCSELSPEEKGTCDDEFNNVYLITDETFVMVDKGNFKSYRAFLRVNKADYEKIIGFSPISTKYFKATIDYTYRLEKTKTIEVKSRTRLGVSGVSGAGVDMTPPSIEIGAPVRVGDKVKISWTTSEESIDVFEWWDVLRPPAIYPPLTTSNEAGYSTSHSRELTGVITNKTYGYKITATDKVGNSAEIKKDFKVG